MAPVVSKEEKLNALKQKLLGQRKQINHAQL
jgi:hypothetical protein